MAQHRQKKRQKRQPPRGSGDFHPPEEHASEAVTVAWTVSVTGVLIANLIVVAVNLFVRSVPDADTARVFEGVMLLSAAAMGATSLALLALVWRVRRVKPPRGYTVFAAFVAAAPIVVTIARLLT